MNANIRIEPEKIAEFCRKHHIRKLALFGSVLRDDFTPESDVDVLVEFELDVRVGLMTLAGMQAELAGLLGREVDLLTPGFFRPSIREQIIREAEVQYAAA